MNCSRNKWPWLALAWAMAAVLHTGCAIPTMDSVGTPGRMQGVGSPRRSAPKTSDETSAMLASRSAQGDSATTAHMSDRFANPLRGVTSNRQVAAFNKANRNQPASDMESQIYQDSNVQAASYNQDGPAELPEEVYPEGELTQYISGQDRSTLDRMTSPSVPAPQMGVMESVSDQPVSSQGHLEHGSSIYGQVLNSPAQPASARALQLHEKNQQLMSELQSQSRLVEELQARIRQHESMWAQAQTDFQEVRRLVDQLNGENSVLNLQVGKLKEENNQLQANYQRLFESMEQTLDELLIKALAQPQSEPVKTQPPVETPVESPVESSQVNAQQASSPQTK